MQGQASEASQVNWSQEGRNGIPHALRSPTVVAELSSHPHGETLKK